MDTFNAKPPSLFNLHNLLLSYSPPKKLYFYIAWARMLEVSVWYLSLAIQPHSKTGASGRWRLNMMVNGKVGGGG